MLVNRVYTMKTNTNSLNTRFTAGALICVWSQLRDLSDASLRIKMELERDSDLGTLDANQELAIARLEQVFWAFDKASTHLVESYFNVGSHRLSSGVSGKHRARKLPKRKYKGKV